MLRIITAQEHVDSLNELQEWWTYLDSQIKHDVRSLVENSSRYASNRYHVHDYYDRDYSDTDQVKEKSYTVLFENGVWKLREDNET